MRKSNGNSPVVRQNFRFSGLNSFEHSLMILALMISTHLAAKSFLGCRYWVNDDLAMLYFANGEWTGFPEKNLVFVHPLFGTLVSSAYQAVPAIPWYPYLMLFSMMLSFLLFLPNVQNRNSKLVTVLISILSIINFTILPTFTFAAIVCATLGLTQVLMNINPPNTRRLLTGSLMLTLGISIRPESKFVALGVAAPLLLYVIWKAAREKWDKNGFVRFIVVSVALSPIFVIQSGSIFCSANNQENCAEWERYSSYNYERGQFHGTQNMEQLKSVYSQLGWTDLDMTLFEAWLYPDDQKFGPVAIHEAYELVFSDKNSIPLEINLVNPVEAINSVPVNSLALVFITFWFCTSGTMNRKITLRDVSFPASILLSWISTLFILSIFRLPPTVTIPMTLVACAVIAITCDLNKISVKNSAKHKLRNSKDQDLVNIKAPKRLLYIASLAAMLLTLADIRDTSNNNKALNATSESALNEMLQIMAGEPLLIYPGISDTLLNQNPWTGHAVMGRANLQVMGWPVFSPHQQNRLDNNRLDGMFKPFVFGSSSFVAGYRFCGPPQYALFVSEYMKQEYGYSNFPNMVKGTKNACETWEFLPN